MNTSQDKPSSTPVMDPEEERIFEAVLQLLRMSLLMGFLIFGGGVIFSVLTIIGAIPGAHTGNVWEWTLVWFGTFVALAFLLGSMFVRPLALRSIMRAKNGQQTG